MTAIKNNPKFAGNELHRQARELRAQAIGQAFDVAVRAVRSWLRRHVADPIEQRAIQRRQFQELLAMDDHMLRDLGLARGNIAYSFEHGCDRDVPQPANVNDPANKAA